MDIDKAKKAIHQERWKNSIHDQISKVPNQVDANLDNVLNRQEFHDNQEQVKTSI